MNKFYCILSFFIITLLFSCRGERFDTINAHIEVKHHADPVPLASVYLKRNVITFPGFDIADWDEEKIADENGVLNYSNLTPGNYYLYCLGHDGIDSVIGHQPLVLDRTMLDQTVPVVLWVSE